MRSLALKMKKNYIKDRFLVVFNISEKTDSKNLQYIHLYQNFFYKNYNISMAKKYFFSNSIFSNSIKSVL